MRTMSKKDGKTASQMEKRNIYALGMTSFLNDVSSDMIAPLLPAFINSLGGGSVALGVVGGLRDSISSLLKVFSGYLADRWNRRKPIVFAGYLISAVFKLLLPFSKSWVHVAFFSSAERVGKGIRTAPRDAIIAESMPKRKGEGFGIHRAMDSLGAVVGSIVALFLLWRMSFEIRSVLIVAGLLSFASLIPLLLVREERVKSGKGVEKLGLALRSLPPELRWVVVAMTVFALANFSYMFFIMKVMNSVSVVNATITAVVFYIIFNVSYTFFAVPFGVLSDRIGRGEVISLGYLLFSAVCLGFYALSSIPAFILLFLLYGVVYAIVDGNQRALIADIAPPELKATALGAFHTTVGLASLPASMVAGVLWSSVSAGATFAYGAVMSLVAAVLLVAATRKFERR